MIFFSAEKLGFYDDNLRDAYEKKGAWPSDAVELTPQEQAEFYIKSPPRDHELGANDEGRPTWTRPAHDIEQLRGNKHAEINTWRDNQEQAPVEHNGHRWDADPTSRARIESVLLAGAMPLDYWTDANNTDRPMTLEQLRALYAAIVQQGGRIHDRQRQMKAEVAALTTIEDVQSYPVGWPIEEPA